MKGRRFLISLLLAAVFLALVRWISGVRLADIIDLFRACRPDFLGFAFAAYAASYGTRALRFKILLRSDSPSFLALCSVVALHNLFNATLPARTGELSYIYLVRSRHGISTVTGIATLAVARILDLLSLMLFFGIGLIHYGARLQFFTLNITAACAAAVVLALLILLFLPELAEFGLRLVQKAAGLFRLGDKGLPGRILAKAGEVPAAFRIVRSRNVLFSAFLASCATWLCIFAACYLALLSFEVVDPAEITFGISIVGTTALNVTCVLPINGLGNLGTWEAGWAAGYMLIGMDKETAFQTGFGLHVAIYLFALLLGALGWKISSRNNSST
jgi:uncharacterized protein (TIRG00374 family)